MLEIGDVVLNIVSMHSLRFLQNDILDNIG